MKKKNIKNYQVLIGGVVKKITELTEEEAKIQLAYAIDILDKVYGCFDKGTSIIDKWSDGQ